METSLLVRENNLYKLNEQLELKARELFEEADTLRTQDQPPNGLQDLQSLHSQSNDQLFSSESSPSASEIRGASKSKPLPVLNDNLLGSAHTHRQCVKGQDDEEQGIGRQTALHLAQVKCQMLEKENENLKIEMKKRAEKLKKSQEDLEKLSESQTKLQKQAESRQKTVYKQQDQLLEVSESLRKKEVENSALKKEIDSLNRNLKKVTQESSNNTLRLNRCMEEIDKMKSASKKAKGEIEEMQESHRQENEQHATAIHCLEKQKSELINGIKKQIQLIDNLKQQLMYIETFKFVKHAEEEFSNCLDSKMQENGPSHS